VLGADKTGDYAVQYFGCVHERYLPFPRKLSDPRQAHCEARRESHNL